MLPTLFATVCALAATASAVVPVEVDGKNFVNSKTGDRFQIIGVDYQPGGAGAFSHKKDPLSSPKDCLRDAALMQRLGVNTVRVYNLSPKLNHDECVSIFNAAGIYMILDVNSPLEGDNLDRTDPAGSYNAEYFKQVFGIIESFKNYPNTLAFFSGNEVINEQSSKEVPAYLRAVQRDMKDYISKHSKRTIPVGYSAADVRQVLKDTVNYFQCELKDAPNSQADFFGLNSYSWCGDSDFHASGYDQLTEQFSNASLPVFFSEYGCNAVQPRYFSEVEALYSEEMSQAFSGGLVYEFVQEENDFGLVKIKDNGDAELMADFENLRTQYAKLDLDRIQTSNKTQTSVEPVECTPDLISSDKFSFDLPERPGEVQGMIDHGCDSVKGGKLVDVGPKDVPHGVFDHNGRAVKHVKLNVVKDDEGNNPGENDSGSVSHDTNDKDKDTNDKDKDTNDKDTNDKDTNDKDTNDKDDNDKDDKDDNDKKSDQDNAREAKGVDKDSEDSKGNKGSDSESKSTPGSGSGSGSDGDSHEYYSPASAAGKMPTSISLGLLCGAVAMALSML